MFAYAVANEVIDLTERLAGIAQLEVVGPASQVSIQSRNQFRQRCVTLLVVDQLPQRLLFPQYRFARGYRLWRTLQSHLDVIEPE